jgi:hypothetical protein
MRSAAIRASCLAFALPFLAGCVTNPFLAGYKGERLGPVPVARVIAEEPAPGTAREIGKSGFQSTSGRTADEAEAIEAARTVGADLVQWSAKQLTREEWVESDPVYERRASGRGQFASYYPIPGTRERWRYTARFWRSVTSAPDPAQQAEPVQQVPSAR